MRTIAPAVPFALLLGCAALGCSSGSSEAVVSGEVFLDDQLLPKGLIRFVPTDGKLSPKDTEIVNGRYALVVPPGEMKVEITAPKVVGKRKMYDAPGSPEVEDVKELLPARFNTQSTLKMTVVPGRQEKRFDVQSK
ncbi:MAG TPA: hypothetical protein VGE74_16595 [Gemmata sp.]